MKLDIDIGLVALATIVISGDKLTAFASSPSAAEAPVLAVALLIAAATLALNPSRLGAIAGRRPVRRVRRAKTRVPQAVKSP